MYDIIIIGGGPAGLTATIYAIRKRLNVLMVAGDLGGKTNFHMDLKDEDQHLVIRGAEVVEKFKRELEYLNFARHMEMVERIDKVNGREGHADHFVLKTAAGGELLAKTVILATGARVQWLNVPGENEYRGKGVGYSALSYAPLFIDKKAVVVGKGELALRSAAELATVAEQVHLVGPSGELLHSPLGKKLLHAKNVTVLEGYHVTQVLGNGFCDAVMVEGPQGFETEIKTDGVFVEMAVIPNSEMVAHLVERDVRGRIIVDSVGRTNVPGLFAAGDVTTTTEQVLVAIGEGAKAALSAYEYLLPTL
jgi:thioredoxin reductase